MLPQEVLIPKGTAIFLEVTNNKFESINIRCETTWFKKVENAVITGVKFSKTLDVDTFNNLV